MEIDITPEEKLKLEYEQEWKGLVSYKDFLSIVAQQQQYDSNSKGYEMARYIIRKE